MGIQELQKQLAMNSQVQVYAAECYLCNIMYEMECEDRSFEKSEAMRIYLECSNTKVRLNAKFRRENRS